MREPDAIVAAATQPLFMDADLLATFAARRAHRRDVVTLQRARPRLPLEISGQAAPAVLTEAMQIHQPLKLAAAARLDDGWDNGHRLTAQT